MRFKIVALFLNLASKNPLAFGWGFLSVPELEFSEFRK
jgi:hypothetical protein